MITCPVCGHQVPDAEFCGACGAHLPTGSRSRLAHYAVDPHEHVLQPSVVTTLFPHLSHRQTALFRIALAVVAIVLIVLGLLRLTGPAIAVAAFAVPLLYAVYLVETGIYRDDPIQTWVATFGVGIILGAIWSWFTGPTVTHALIRNLTLGLQARDLLISGVPFRLSACCSCWSALPGSTCAGDSAIRSTDSHTVRRPRSASRLPRRSWNWRPRCITAS